MRTITFEITECRPDKCIFFKENSGMGHCPVCQKIDSLVDFKSHRYPMWKCEHCNTVFWTEQGKLTCQD